MKQSENLSLKNEENPISEKSMKSIKIKNEESFPVENKIEIEDILDYDEFISGKI